MEDSINKKDGNAVERPDSLPHSPEAHIVIEDYHFLTRATLQYVTELATEASEKTTLEKASKIETTVKGKSTGSRKAPGISLLSDPNRAFHPCI